ncbi:hypothetical protein [Alicyclobacillus macrosporangiidus]|uniref:Uncharacterized protein n=1 Tax=Alicyclobacillus macrosporangiidus TaxID=392015 RepID=A0A1I7L2B6_9BACL|nr:hypothetical protein [Alicyclobacillus macrosporangiidus]SFV03758.1 hypothetical protein SAMN05421543_12331 [Alicyclobacillus macrosporangiidus]
METSRIDEILREYYALRMVVNGLTILAASHGKGINLGSIENEILYHLGETAHIMRSFTPLMLDAIQAEVQDISSSTIEESIELDNPFVLTLSPIDILLGRRNYETDQQQGDEYLTEKIRDLRKRAIATFLEVFDPVTIRRVQKELERNSDI